MTLRRCRECGLPLRLSQGYTWPGDGTITARHDPSMRMVVFEADYFGYVWRQLGELLRVSIADIMIRGQQAGAWDYLESNVIFGWRKVVLPHIPSLLFVRRIINELALFGFGGLEVVEYKRKKLLILKVKDPFDIISLVWGIKGFIEFVEGEGTEMAWNREGNEYIISADFKQGRRADLVDSEVLRMVREAKMELSPRTNPPPPRSGLDSCASCGVPSALTDLLWREEEGTIYRRGTDTRFIFTTGHIFIAVIRELERQAGRELEPMLLDITRNYHLGILRGVPLSSRGSAYHSTARNLAAGGFGYVTDMSYGEGHLEMTIANPFYLPRLLGRIVGLFEYIEGQEADLEYMLPEPGTVEIKIKTA